MNVLIVAATAPEIAEFSRSVQTSGKIRQGRVETLVTGVGMTETAFALGRKLTQDPQWDLILNAGIAGSFDRSLRLGQVVAIVEDRIAELGAEDGDDFLPLEELGLGRSAFTSDWKILKEQFFPLSSLEICSGITVNRVHGKEDSILETTRRFGNVRTESMEGAAVFLAARHFGIPVLQIRAISNYVERRNRDSWNIPLAVEALNAWLIDFVVKIP